MKHYFITLLDMFRNVISYTTSDTNKPTTESVPALKDAIEITLTNKVKAIDDLINPQSVQIQGFAQQKNLLKDNTATLAMSIINAGKSFAKVNNNLVLLGKLKYSFTKLRTITDATFAEKVNGIVALLSPMLAALQPYGITQASFDKVTDATSAYRIFLTRPRQEIVSRKTTNELLSGMFSDTNEFIRTIIDPLVFSMQENNKQYCIGYRASRKHNPHGTHHTHLLATVVNELGEPYFDVTVTVDEFTVTDPGTLESTTSKAVAANTDINGNADVSTFEAGPRTVTVSGKNIITKTFPAIQFERGKSISKTFICAPAFNPPAATQENKTEKTKPDTTTTK